MPKNKKALTKRRALKKLRRVRRQRAASLGERVQSKQGAGARGEVRVAQQQQKSPILAPVKPSKTITRRMK